MIKRLTYFQRRYRDDPVYRLHKVNARRAKLGLPLLAKVEDIGVGYGDHQRARARHRGRFI